MYSICIFTQSPLSKAPRVVKEANVYSRAGYNVTVYALWYDKMILDKDRALLDSNINYKSGINLLDSNSWNSKLIRFKRRIARELVKYARFNTVSSLGYSYPSYLSKLRNENADLYIGHEEMSMALAKDLIRDGRSVVFDFEDWHSKDLLPEDRKYRPIKLLEKLEGFVLKNAEYTYTTSNALAQALAATYKTDKPHVIYNCFYSSERNSIDKVCKDRQSSKLPSIYWFSQHISAGRGLELLMEALPHIKSKVELHLRGTISDEYKSELLRQMPEGITLFIHDLIPHNELISRINEHSLGLALEEIEPASRDLTITNKIFHYFQAGIPILATQTQGQLELSEKAPSAVCLVDRSPQKMAKAIDLIMSDHCKLDSMRASSLKAGKQQFSFEKEEEKLLKWLNDFFQT